MSKERIYIHLRTTDGTLGAQINDPQRQADYATDLRIETRWPGGYDLCSFKIRCADIFGANAIWESQTVIVRDGQDIIFDGRINSLARSMSGTDEYFVVNCTGWIVILNNDRYVWAWWINNMLMKHLAWPADRTRNNDQNSFVATLRDNYLSVKFGTADLTRSTSDRYMERCTLPPGQYVRRVTYDYRTTNAGQVERIVKVGRAAGREPATLAEVRGLLCSH